MKTLPFWKEGLNQPAAIESSSLPSRVDVAIIGAGYTGLNAAHVLAKNDAAVAILEQNTIGWGASSRNGGMLTTGLKVPPDVLFRRYGQDLGRALWQASVDAIDLVENTIRDEQIDCHFRRTGHVYLAAKPSHFKVMQKKLDLYNNVLNHPVQLVPPAELSAEIATDVYFGGLVDESSAALHPAKYVMGLALTAIHLGVKICENTKVTGIGRNGNGFRLQTSQGRLEAEEVLIATNGYTGTEVPQLKPRIFSGGSYIIVTEPLPPEVAKELSPRARMFFDSRNFLNYFRLTPDGRMLFGGRNSLSPNENLFQSAVRLRQRMLEVFPQLTDFKLTHSWSGNLGLTFDLLPHIGQLEGVYYALGYSGHGISLATYLGTEAGLILTGQKTSSPFLEITHPTRFFYRRRAWFLPFAAKYFQLRDRLS